MRCATPKSHIKRPTTVWNTTMSAGGENTPFPSTTEEMKTGLSHRSTGTGARQSFSHWPAAAAVAHAGIYAWQSSAARREESPHVPHTHTRARNVSLIIVKIYFPQFHLCAPMSFIYSIRGEKRNLFVSVFFFGVWKRFGRALHVRVVYGLKASADGKVQ